MKFNKIYSLLAAAVVVTAFSSCEDVTDPKFQQPDAESFTILTSPMQDQYYKLTEDGTFELTLSGQPNYGFSAVTQYRAQVSLDGKFDNEENYVELVPTGTGTLSRMTLSELALAEAICQLHGVTSEDDYVDHGEETVYFRGVAFINNVDKSYITTSNVTTLNRVQAFFSVAKPGAIYCIGNYVGKWIDPLEANADALEPYTLFENDDEIRSKIYHGIIDFQPTNLDEGSIFRFYTALGGWDKNSIGCAGGPDSDTPQEFPDFKAGSTFTHELAETKDSFKFNKYTGKIQFTIDLNKMEGTMVAVAD